ncbi:MAG: serine/threonine-protein kinase [Gemmatimonadota bacterium]|jgi:serine/threonine-protein kinase
MENEERLRAALADRYAIEREIGAGGMATVYLARDLKHDRKVAVKVLDPELAQNLGSKRFLWEIKTAASLTHPHILPVHDSGEADGLLFYVMPYVKGESLRTRLTKERQLPVEDAVQITQEIAGALAYAHDEGIIHRDVKPANIMLEAGQAVLADFGVAHAVVEAGGDRLTRTGTSLGTPSYMSPEQASGEESLDARSDIYSLGCVLYEMLAGEPPFTGPSPAAVLARQVQERLPSLDVVRPNLPKGLVAAVERALAKVPADRYKTATEFKEALKVEALQPEAAQAQAPQPKRSRLGRGRILGAVALAFVALFWVDRVLESCDGGVESDIGRKPRIAVTYFTSAGADPTLAALGDALTEYVADGLVGLGSLEVLPQNAMRPYRGAGLPSGAIDSLAIDAYVEGAVMGTPDRVSVSVQLIDAEDHTHLASRVVEGSAGEPFEIVEELAGEVSRILRDWLGIRIEMEGLRAGTESEAAWTLVQQADRRWDEAVDLAESGDTAAAAGVLMEADGLLEMAEAQDPDFVTPIVNRGWVASELARLGTTRESFEPTWTRVGLDHADRAVAKDPSHARALELRGILLDYLASEADTGEEADSLRSLAERDLLRATELDDSRCRGYARLSRIYERQSRYAEAKSAALKAYTMDPYQMDAEIVLFRLCSASLELREWVAVDQWCGEGRRRFPDRPSFASAWLAALAGPEGPEPDPDSAWHWANEVVRLSAPHERDWARPPQFLQVSAVLARAGLTDSARAVLDRTLALPEAVGPRTFVQEANARLRLGDVDGALNALQRFLEASPSARAGLPANWWWEELWDHPRFKELTGTAGEGSGSG